MLESLAGWPPRGAGGGGEVKGRDAVLAGGAEDEECCWP